MYSYSIFERKFGNNSTFLFTTSCIPGVDSRGKGWFTFCSTDKRQPGEGVDDIFTNVRGRSEISQKLGYDVIVLVWTRSGRVVTLL